MGVGGQRHALAALLPGKTRYPMCRRLGGPQGRSGRVRKISPPTGIRSPDRLVRNQSLYRLLIQCVGKYLQSNCSWVSWSDSYLTKHSRQALFTVSVDSLAYNAKEMGNLPMNMTSRRGRVFAPWTLLRCSCHLILWDHTFCFRSQLYIYCRML